MESYSRELALPLARSAAFGEGRNFRLQIPDAEQRIKKVMTTFYTTGGIKKPPQWRTEYGQIIEWCQDSKGKSLLLNGGVGVGKTTIALLVLPELIKDYYGLIVKCYSASELNEREKEVKAKMLLTIDDIGLEGVKNDYGNKSMVLPAIVDRLEREGGLLILTTNLNAQGLKDHYGTRCWDRMQDLFDFITIRGEGMRHKDLTPSPEAAGWYEEQRRLYEEQKLKESDEYRHQQIIRQRLDWQERRAAECGVSREEWLRTYARDLDYLRKLYEAEQVKREKWGLKRYRTLYGWMQAHMLYDNFPDKERL